VLLATRAQRHVDRATAHGAELRRTADHLHGLFAEPTAAMEMRVFGAVDNWIHRYNTGGTSGLCDRLRTGRPQLGSPRLAARIRRLLAQPKAWTIGRLWAQLGRPAISQRTLRRRVRQVARWRRPRLVAKGDPDRDQVLADLQQQLSDLPDGAVVLAEDETHINLLPWVRATWIATGQRQLVMTPGTNRRRTIFGAVDLATGRFFYQVARKAISATFTGFCEQLLAAYPSAPVVAVVCDNVIIHRSKLVKRWLAAHPRMRVLHGARYSPHDNPVERIWGALKAWLANSPTLTVQGRIRQVHAFFRQQRRADAGDRRAAQLPVAARRFHAKP
jgi:transposase